MHYYVWSCFFSLCLGSVLNCWTFSVSLSGPSAEQMLADLQPSSSHVLLVRHQQDALMWQHDGNVNTPKHHAKQWCWSSQQVMQCMNVSSIRVFGWHKHDCWKKRVFSLLERQFFDFLYCFKMNVTYLDKVYILVKAVKSLKCQGVFGGKCQQGRDKRSLCFFLLLKSFLANIAVFAVEL